MATGTQHTNKLADLLGKVLGRSDGGDPSGRLSRDGVRALTFPL